MVLIHAFLPFLISQFSHLLYCVFFFTADISQSNKSLRGNLKDENYKILMMSHDKKPSNYLRGTYIWFHYMLEALLLILPVIK